MLILSPPLSQLIDSNLLERSENMKYMDDPSPSWKLRPFCMGSHILTPNPLICHESENFRAQGAVKKMSQHERRNTRVVPLGSLDKKQWVRI